MFRPGGSRGSPIPPTISPRIDWLKYSPESSTETSGVRNGFRGSVERISWRCGSLGSFTPASCATSGLQAPAAITTVVAGDAAAVGLHRAHPAARELEAGHGGEGLHPDAALLRRTARTPRGTARGR